MVQRLWLDRKVDAERAAFMGTGGPPARQYQRAGAL